MVVKMLASRELPFRGDGSTLGNPHNNHFLMALEMIAHFYIFLANHLTKYGNSVKDHTSYISYSTYKQFILLLAKNVENVILQEIKDTWYFSMS